MQQPPGFQDGSGLVCVLMKSLYGLKQAPRVWNQTLGDHLTSLGCKERARDAALQLFWSEQHGLVLILVYVDDMQIAAARADTVQ